MKRRADSIIFGLRLLFVIISIVSVTDVRAQSLDDRLDEDAFLRGLIELGLPEIIEHYIETHPPVDAVQNAQYRIVLERLKATNDELSTDETRASIERILDMREKLIEQLPNDPRRATWLLDQAADLYFDLLRLEGTGLTALFGLPSSSQRSTAQRVAEQMVSLTDDADRAIDNAVIQLESEPGYRTDEQLQMKRRRLVTEERERRLAFLRGVGLVLHAELNVASASARRRLYERAAASLEPLEERLDGVLAVRARLFRGFALARMGYYDQGEEHFRATATDPASTASDVFAARMCGVLNRVQARGPSSGLTALASIEPKYQNRASLFFRVLIADQRFILRDRLAGESTGAARARALREAYESYTNLLDAESRDEIALLRPIVHDRLARAAGEDAPLDELPPIVTIALAEQALQRGRTNESIIRFEAALARDDRTREEDATALFGLGRAHYAADDPRESIERLTMMASKYPAHPDAPRSIELAASIGAEWTKRAPADREAFTAASDALSVLLSKFPSLPSINRWRFVAGRLALVQREHDAAVTAFESIPAGAPEWLDARFMRAAAMRAAADALDESGRSQRAQEVMNAVNNAIAPIRAQLDRVDHDRRADLEYYLAHLQVMQAGALLDALRPEEAIETLQSIESAPGVDSSILAAALRVRIAAYQALHRPEDAQQQLVRFIDTSPAEAGPVLDSMIVHASREVENLLRADRVDEAQTAATRELGPLAGLLERWLRTVSFDAADRPGMLEHTARAYRLASRFRDALRIYDELANDQADAIEVVFGRAECFYGLGGDEYGEAMMLYKRIAAGGREIGHDIYWTSQLRMLQILDAVNRNTHQIPPRIEQLRKEDENFGGPRYRRQLLALLNKYR